MARGAGYLHPDYKVIVKNEEVSAILLYFIVKISRLEMTKHGHLNRSVENYFYVDLMEARQSFAILTFYIINQFETFALTIKKSDAVVCTGFFIYSTLLNILFKRFKAFNKFSTHNMQVFIPLHYAFFNADE